MAVVVRLCEELVRVGGQEGLLLLPVGHPNCEHGGLRHPRLLRLQAFQPDPRDSLAAHREPEPVGGLLHLGQRQRDAPDVGLVSHAGSRRTGCPRCPPGPRSPPPAGSPPSPHGTRQAPPVARPRPPGRRCRGPGAPAACPAPASPTGPARCSARARTPASAPPTRPPAPPAAPSPARAPQTPSP